MSLDILMAISDVSGGTWIAAEGQSNLTAANDQSTDDSGLSNDTLAKDLEAGKLFEVDDFSLGLGLEDRSDEDVRLLGEEALNEKIRKLLKAEELSKLAGGKVKTSKRKFESWIKNDSKWRNREGGYPLDFQEFRLTRQLDKASSFFFEACCNSWTLKKAALLKRKAASGGLTQTYLRLDFADVLVTSVDWDVEDTVKEKIKFICRAARVTYRPQLNTGAMGSARSREWDPLDKLPAPPWGG